MTADEPPGGRVAYLILAHRRPHQVAALAQRITHLSPQSRIVVHWDARSGPFPAGLLPPAATVVPNPVRGGWGRWSLVEASLRMLAVARREFQPRWSVLLSGDDWPARDLAEWERELDEAGGDALIASSPVVDRRAAGESAVPLREDEVRRYRDSWLIVPPAPFPFLNRVLRAIVRRIEPFATRRPRGLAMMDFYDRGVAVSLGRSRLDPPLRVHKGAQWLTLGPRAVDAVLGADPRIVRHFRRTLIPDEAFIPSVVNAAPGLSVRAGLTSFAPWHAFHRSQLDLAVEDLAAIAASGAPFARKLPSAPPNAVTAALDELARRHERA
jgi:hypothetical protein